MRLCFLVITLLAGFAAGAQQKIGHADWVYIFSQLPEVTKIQIELKGYEAQLQNQLKAKSQEFETKYKGYQELPVNTPEAIKKDKESELAYLRDNIQKFQQDASNSLQKKEQELMVTVFSKVGKAIEEVARENGYSYIFNPQVMGGGDVLLFTDEKDNISNLVLLKMGIKPSQQGQSQKVE
jgi:outer membrane protein